MQPYDTAVLQMLLLPISLRVEFNICCVYHERGVNGMTLGQLVGDTSCTTAVKKTQLIHTLVRSLAHSLTQAPTTHSITN